MSHTSWIQFWQYFFLLYVIVMYSSYLLLNLISLVSLWRYMQCRSVDDLPHVYSGFEPPISIIVPAYNEEEVIAGSVKSFLQLSYPEYEVVVVNDGSRDATLEILKQEFNLVLFPEAYRVRIKTQPVHAVYRSTLYPNLRVIDKVNGGRADALNVGINNARYPLVCAVDADSMLQRDSLYRVVQPFLRDPDTIACGGTIRVANGCEVRDGFLLKVDLPRNPLALMQTVEYLRAFQYGRLGWSVLRSLLIISGAFGLFDKEKVVAVGGFRADTMGEDMELTLRLHYHMRTTGKPYRITFLPDPICWTEVPEDWRTLMRQRMRWQQGLSESLLMNLRLLFHPRGGTPGWLGFPYMIVFEWLAPLVEMAGYAFFAIGWLTGVITAEAAIVFFLLAIGMGLLPSVSALLLEEISFHLYPKQRHLWILFLAAIVEHIGYRQVITLWRFVALIKWMAGVKGEWGEMKRKPQTPST